MSCSIPNQSTSTSLAEPETRLLVCSALRVLLVQSRPEYVGTGTQNMLGEESLPVEGRQRLRHCMCVHALTDSSLHLCGLCRYFDIEAIGAAGQTLPGSRGSDSTKHGWCLQTTATQAEINKCLSTGQSCETRLFIEVRPLATASRLSLVLTSQLLKQQCCHVEATTKALTA